MDAMIAFRIGKRFKVARREKRKRFNRISDFKQEASSPREISKSDQIHLPAKKSHSLSVVHKYDLQVLFYWDATVPCLFLGIAQRLHLNRERRIRGRQNQVATLPVTTFCLDGILNSLLDSLH